MFYFISLLICICVVGLVVYMYLKTSRLEEDLSREQIRNTQHLATIESLEGEKTSFRNQIVILEDHAKSLSKYEGIYDVEQQIKILNDENQRLAQNTVEQAKLQSSEIIEQARLSADSINKIASETIEEANRQKRFLESEGQRKLHEAETQATKIVGEAYEDYKELRDLKKSLTAIQNTIDGYGDSYIVPSHSFIDVLADQYGYTEYAKELKKIRKEIRELSAKGMAASCDYVEQSRKDTAVRFVTDAFNGKVDSILSEVSDENYGVLSQRVVDSFNLVNLNGKAFRNAVITKSYLDLRITELRLSSTIQHLKSEEREEQKRIREQMREEERARREYEKAIKEAAKEEEVIRKAMEKIRSEILDASQEEKAGYESKIKELNDRLIVAEEKNRRALSMAQQTKRGHIYIISNVGSFGDNVYKVGMTRRLDPYERVKELGDASVPFEFDVHAVIFSEDAPKFEKEMHKAFAMAQVNKVNPRKEFFKMDLKGIRQKIEEMNIDATWTMTAAAVEYKETLSIEKSLKGDNKFAIEWKDQFLHKIDEVDVVDSGATVSN